MRCLLCVAVAVLLQGGVAFAQDPAKVDPKHCKVEFEDANVRVLRWHVGPHEKIPMHEHPAFVSISLTGGHSMYALPDGKTKEDNLEPGQVTWSAGEKHANESLTDKPTETIQVELKTRPAARTPAAEKENQDDSTKLDPKHYKLELENDYARVIRVRYGPGEKSVMHHHPRLIAINLSGGNFAFTLADGTMRENPGKPGDVNVMPAESHLPQNRGDSPSEVILVEPK